MGMLYDDSTSAWGWAGHVDGGWESGRPVKKQRRDSGRKYGSIVKPLARLVRDSWDTVGVLAESLNGVALSVTGDEKVGARTLTLEQRRLIQEERISGAKALEQWTQAAEELDRLDGCDAWRADDESDDYNFEAIRAKIAELESARDNEDLTRMLRLIRTTLSREVAGIGESALWQHSRIGTKHLIERYVVTAVDTIESATRLAARCSMDGERAQKIKQDMLNTRQAYGRTALLLSGGGTFGMMHIGVVKAMFEAGVLPRVISGTSAGSIVASVLCTRKDDEVPNIVRDFCHGDLSVFSKPGADESLSGKLHRFRTEGQVYDIKHLEDVMRGHLGDMTFQEAYNRTQRILCIAVSSVDQQDEPVLLSYATTPNVIIRSAVAASCSVPGIYASAGLQEKCPHTGTMRAYGGDMHRFIDGSISHDLPLVRLQEMYDVNHFVVSQVNPHVVPFLRHAAALYGPNPSPDSRWWDAPLSAAKAEVVRRLGSAADLADYIPHPQAASLLRTTCHISRSILEQQYTGDITILPDTSSLADWLTILSNPTPDFMARAMRNGERATWPEIDRIRKRTAVEHALDRSVKSSLERVAFSPSQVELRLARMRKHSGKPRHLRGRRCTTPDEHGDARKPATPPPHRLARKRSQSLSPASISKPTPSRSRSRSPAPLFINSSTSPLPSSTDATDPDSDFDSDSDSETVRMPSRTHYPIATASLPSTPFTEHRRFPFSDSPQSASPKTPLSPTLTMTPSAPAPAGKVGEAEARYKKIFHGIRRLSGKAGKRESVGEGSKAGGAGLGAEDGGAELWSGRHRGDGRRVESTGRQGLRPPERQ